MKDTPPTIRWHNEFKEVIKVTHLINKNNNRKTLGREYEGCVYQFKCEDDNYPYINLQ